MVIRQHIFHLLVKGSSRNRHRPTGEVVQALFAGIRSRDPALARHIKREVFGTWLHIAIYIAATKCGVGFSDGCF